MPPPFNFIQKEPLSGFESKTITLVFKEPLTARPLFENVSSN